MNVLLNAKGFAGVCIEIYNILSLLYRRVPQINYLPRERYKKCIIKHNFKFYFLELYVNDKYVFNNIIYVLEILFKLSLFKINVICNKSAYNTFFTFLVKCI